MRIHAYVLIVLAFGALSCKKEAGPWATFIECSSNACVAEAIAVKDAFLENPQALLEQFAKTYEKGEDHVVGWIYLLRDSVLLNGSFAEPQVRFDLQQAIIQAAKPFENDPKLGEMAKSVLDEVEMLAIASEMEEEIPTEIVPFAGTYSYELPNEAGSGELNISVVNSESIRFALSVVGSGPAFNQGVMEGIAKMTGYNQFEYETSEFGGACKLELVFTGNMVSVSTLEGDSPSCGFGNNVRADGEYNLVNHDDPFLTPADAKKVKKMEGDWVSADDPKSGIAIKNSMYYDNYDGETLGAFRFQYYPKCPDDCAPAGGSPCFKIFGQDELCYEIVFSDSKTLQISLISGTGKTLTYKRR